jgi:predicted TIM-barrel fold metal-dependent hydrolase
MKIIDFRMRPSTPEMVSVADSRAYKDLLMKKAKPYDKRIYPVEETIREMDEVGIALGVIPGRDIETTYQWKVTNDHLAEIVQKFPKRFVAFAGVDPNKGMSAVREVERAVKGLGLKGVALDPYLHWKPANDKIFYPIYAKCAELEVPIMLTAGPGAHVPGSIIAHAAPATIDEVAKDFPELTIIAGHGCYPFVTEMIALALRHDNVYFDIGAYELFPGSDLYVQAANTILTNKLVLASGHPLTNMKEALQRYEKLPFNKQTRENVYYRNAERVLKIKI